MPRATLYRKRRPSLRDEHEFAASASSVRRYVASRKVGQGEVFLPLCFAPGEEGQVDWGEAHVLENGVERTVQLFCMKLCHSHAVFVRAYERANLESFLDGHVRAFAFFGGVPKRLAYDNLKSAVILVGRGRERRSESAVCGTAELVPVRQPLLQRGQGEREGARGEPGEAVAADLLDAPAGDPGPRRTQREARWRTAGRNWSGRTGKATATATLWEAEKPCLLPLPAEPFPACQERSSIVDKELLVQFDEHLYSVPLRWAHHPCVLKGFVDRVEIYCQHQQVAVHRRSYGADRFVLEPRHYLPLLARKPGALDQARPFQGDPLGRGVLLAASGIGVSPGRRRHAAVYPRPAADDRSIRKTRCAGP